MIKCENLTHIYKGDNERSDKTALRGLNLEIEKGSFVAVAGHNGSGKSTLSKHFNAILLPSGGKVYVDDFDTADEKIMLEIRKKVGMVFQNPDNQIVSAIVEEDVAFAPENLGIEPDEIRRRVDDALKSVGMYDQCLASPANLSGGQKQRIAIAGVLAMEPEYIVLDEPTAMLDPIGRKEVISTIKKLNKEKHITVVLITHYMNEAAEADRIIVMKKGKVVLDGKPNEVFSHTDEIKSAGLDVPQSCLICDMLRQRGMPIKKGVISPEECIEEISKLL